MSGLLLPGSLIVPGVRKRRSSPTPPSFTPADLGADLWGWWEDTGLAGADGDPLAQWDDASGNGHHLLQATGANQPVKKTNILNGLPVARFDGSNDFLNAAGLVAQPVHLFTVTRFNGAFDGSHRGIADSVSVAYGHLLYRLSSTEISLYAGGGSVTVTTTPEAFHYYSAYFDGASSLLSADGGTDATGNPGTGGAATGLCVGASGGGTGDPGGIDVAEVVACSAQITGTDLTDLFAYFASRFAL